MGNTDFQHGYNDPDYRTHDPPTYQQACMGILTCPHCGKAVMCGDVNGTLPNQPEDTMIPRGQATTTTTQQQGGTRRRKGTGLRYLSAEMLSTSHQMATITEARVQDDTFRPGAQCVVAKLKFKGEFLLWTLRPGNPCLETIGDVFGDDERSWGNREIELYTEVDTFDGKTWIRVEPIVASSAPKKSGR